MKVVVVSLLVVVLATLLCTPARAHQVGLSRGTYTQGDEGVDVELVFARGEAAQAVAGLDANNDGKLDQAEVDAAAARMAGDIVGNVRVDVAGEGGTGGTQACAGSFVGASLTEEDGLAVRAKYACERSGRTTVDFVLASRMATGHRHLAHTVAPGEGGALSEQDHVAFSGATSFTFGKDAPPPSRLAFVGIGVEHILLGFDHLVFLFGLVLIGGRLRSMLAVVTAFTLAHSVTLGLAVMGVLTPPPVIIEPLIALSIAYVGIENFFVKSAAGRWRITAPFGLVHGFGFAGALAEVGVPKDDVPLTLVLFNVGVEAGQLAVLAVVLPLLHLARSKGVLNERVTKGASVVIVLLGVFWLVERVLGALGILDATPG